MTTETRAPRTSWCLHCRRAVLHSDEEWRLVDNPDGSLAGVICGRCWSKADVGPDVPLTYEEEEGTDGREGQPEFNGAFGGN